MTITQGGSGGLAETAVNLGRARARYAPGTRAWTSLRTQRPLLDEGTSSYDDAGHSGRAAVLVDDARESFCARGGAYEADAHATKPTRTTPATRTRSMPSRSYVPCRAVPRSHREQKTGVPPENRRDPDASRKVASMPDEGWPRCLMKAGPDA
ncbi:hypothetical protein [Streptomyces sp. NPDC058291]|uniref:hypothetical protein n=1 Tax=Streptomyces sp. NPDC058291 TaxID=3346427 RepID=UPI0036E31951